jgi:hypothetical protein
VRSSAIMVHLFFIYYYYYFFFVFFFPLTNKQVTKLKNSGAKSTCYGSKTVFEKFLTDTNSEPMYDEDLFGYFELYQNYFSTKNILFRFLIFDKFQIQIITNRGFPRRFSQKQNKRAFTYRGLVFTGIFA